MVWLWQNNGFILKLDDDLQFYIFFAIAALSSFKGEKHATTHCYIGFSRRTSRPAKLTTPFAELQAHAVRVRSVLEAYVPRFPVALFELVGRERALVYEGVREHEPIERDIMGAIVTM